MYMGVSDTNQYKKNYWTSVPLCSSCRIPSNTPTTSINQEVLVENELIRTLLGDKIIDFNSYMLIKSIIEPSQSIKSTDDEWIKFGEFLGLKRPTKGDVRQHIINKWKKIKHAAEVRRKRDSNIPEEVKEIKRKKELIASAQKNIIKNFRYIKNPECIVDQYGKTLVHLGVLDDHNAITEANNAVNSYYFHMIKEESHRSNSFWKDLTEHFGAYRSYTMLPYTSSETASSHNANHQGCVDNLLNALQPLSNSISRFVNQHYEHYYTKLSELTWGPFAPRSFGIFPTIALNFNVISNYHWDDNDDPNGLCFVVALGDFEGGELCFPQLEIIVELKSGQVVAFPSKLLLHGNLAITRGIRFSIVSYVSKGFFLKDTKDTEMADTNNHQDFFNAEDLNLKRTSHRKPKSFQTCESDKKSDNRRYDYGKYIFI